MSASPQLPPLLPVGSLEYFREPGRSAWAIKFDELAPELRVSAFGVLVPGEVAAQLMAVDHAPESKPARESAGDTVDYRFGGG